MNEHRRRADRIMAPEYTQNVESRSDEELNAMHTESVEVETEISYLRRLAQARMDILQAEIDRRAAGGSVGDLIKALPQILTSGESSGAPDPADVRMPQHFAPNTEVIYARGLEHLVSDTTLANLPTLSENDLRETLELLKGFEKEMSEARKQLHEVLSTIEKIQATRRKVANA